MVNIRLAAPELFGKDAAEDEDADVFEGYIVERVEFSNFVDPRNRVLVVRAYKGEGKSALLRFTESRVASVEDEKAPIVIKTTGASLAPSLGDNADHDSWVRAWKESMLGLIAAEIGSRIGLPFSGDAMTLREEADRNGFKAGSLVWVLGSRMSVEAKGVKLTLASKERPNKERLLQRWQNSAPAVWLIVDDIDQNFENTRQFCIRTASFFTAVRQVVNLVPDVHFRLAIRPNVWAILKREFESLSHMEAYMVDLSWSEESMRMLLARRVYGYVRYTGQLADLGNLPADRVERDKALIGLAFQSAMSWGGPGRMRPPHVVLHTLSKHRPRWAIELARVAGLRAQARGNRVVELDDITSELTAFGRRRIEDTVAEFRSQCAEVDEVLAAFMQQADLYKTNELIALIERRVLQATKPKIVGVLGEPRAKDIAHFLFQIGFIYGRREKDDGEYDHVSFSQQPGLLKDRTNLDDGLAWEVHPVFREALDLHDPTRVHRR